MGDIKDESDVLVLYGDTPLTPAPLLQDLIASLHGREMSVLTAFADNPFGYGRIISPHLYQQMLTFLINQLSNTRPAYYCF